MSLNILIFTDKIAAANHVVVYRSGRTVCRNDTDTSRDLVLVLAPRHDEQVPVFNEKRTFIHKKIVLIDCLRRQ